MGSTRTSQRGHVLLAAALASAPLGLAACGDGRPAPQAEPTSTTTATSSPATGSGSTIETIDLSSVDFVDATDAEQVDVVARDNEFQAPFVEVRAGTTVTFTNRGSRHDVRPAVEGAFAGITVEELGRGEPSSITFAQPGDYVYYCSIHGTPRKGMVGAIRVVG